MKKFLLYASAVSAMMLAGSCQKEVLEPVSEGEATVTFALELPNTVETKAMSQAEATNIVYYEIWNSDWSRQLYPVDASALASKPVSGRQAQIEMKLVANQTYNFIFWAQNDSHNAYDVNELKNVKVNYDAIAGNDDKYDAFYATRQIKVTGPINETVQLYRPFAQLNFGASVMETDLGPINVTGTEVTVTNLATVFNTIEGVGQVDGNAATATFTAPGIATDEALVTGGSSYTWVTMDYMLMMDEQSLVDVEGSFGIDGMDAAVVRTVTNVPLQRNHRTNIIGDLFSVDAVLNIIVEPAFDQPDENIHFVESTVSVATAAELQDAVNNAPQGTTEIKLAGDIAGDVVVAQNKNVHIVINGEGHDYQGVITVDGKSATLTSASLLIKNMTFNAASISADACIRLGNGTNATRYTCNVKVENCTFDVAGAVGVKSYTGGDKNLAVIGCTATANAHSLVQAKGIEIVRVEKCTVNSKNGMNFNNSTDVVVRECTADVKGYAVRFGESSGGSKAAEVYSIKNSTLKSAGDDGDAVIILRGTADYSTLTIENTTLEGPTQIANTATGAKVIIDGIEQ